MSDKKIIGYRLLRELPALKIGIVFKFNSNQNFYECELNNSLFTYRFTEEQMHDLFRWFEPVYEEKKNLDKIFEEAAWKEIAKVACQYYKDWGYVKKLDVLKAFDGFIEEEHRACSKVLPALMLIRQKLEGVK